MESRFLDTETKAHEIQSKMACMKNSFILYRHIWQVCVQNIYHSLLTGNMILVSKFETISN